MSSDFLFNAIHSEISEIFVEWKELNDRIKTLKTEHQRRPWRRRRPRPPMARARRQNQLDMMRCALGILGDDARHRFVIRAGGVLTREDGERLWVSFEWESECPEFEPLDTGEVNHES